jgi:hypothetical protein
MPSKNFFIGALLLIGLAYAISEEITQEDVEEFHYDCKKIVWKIAKKVVSQFRICTAELRERIPDDKERSKYIQCAVKCTMMRLELVNNATGLISDEDADRFLTKIIKPQFFDIARVIIGGCVEDFDSVTEAERNEEYCTAYGNVLKCLQNQVTEVSSIC